MLYHDFGHSDLDLAGWPTLKKIVLDYDFWIRGVSYCCYLHMVAAGELCCLSDKSGWSLLHKSYNDQYACWMHKLPNFKCCALLSFLKILVAPNFKICCISLRSLIGDMIQPTVWNLRQFICSLENSVHFGMKFVKGWTLIWKNKLNKGSLKVFVCMASDGSWRCWRVGGGIYILTKFLSALHKPRDFSAPEPKAEMHDCDHALSIVRLSFLCH